MFDESTTTERADATRGLGDLDPINVTSPVLSLTGEIATDLVTCSFGPGNAEDFVLHIEPSHPRRPFPKSLRSVYEAMHTRLSKVFPNNITVEIVPPASDWLVQHIVLVAKDAMQQWSFNESDVEKALPALLEQLDKIITDEYARQRAAGQRPARR